MLKQQASKPIQPVGHSTRICQLIGGALQRRILVPALLAIGSVHVAEVPCRGKRTSFQSMQPPAQGAQDLLPRMRGIAFDAQGEGADEKIHFLLGHRLGQFCASADKVEGIQKDTVVRRQQCCEHTQANVDGVRWACVQE